ncbi:MAG: efflux RND transporter periplasmic adaptor subunit [Steroidobacteraceae bacterium]
MTSTPRLTFGALLLIVTGAAAGYWYAKHRASDEPMADMSGSADRKPLYWHDPMVPGTRFDKPGKSPFMDMQLVPVYADEINASPGVRIDSAMSQTLGVRTGKVERAVFAQSLKAVGSVAFDERLLALLPARVDGYVQRLHVKAPLEHVRQGQPLAEITAPQWIAAQEEYLSLLDAQSDRGKAVRDAARQRLLVLGVPESTVAAIERDHKTYVTTSLLAPRDGVLTEILVREGSAFIAGSSLFRINGLATVWVIAQLPEVETSLAAPGSPVDVMAVAWPGQHFKGRVTALLPQLDPATRTISVRMEVANPDGRLVPGMSVSLEIAKATPAAQLLIPSEAVIVTGTRSVVILRRGERFEVADVSVGSESGGRTSILSGLAEGDEVVLSGQFLLDSEANLKAGVDRLQAPASDTTP